MTVSESRQRRFICVVHFNDKAIQSESQTIKQKGKIIEIRYETIIDINKKNVKIKKI